MAVDVTGNLFIPDVWSSRIRRVDASTGIITTVVGTGAPGFSGDGGTATSASLEMPWDVRVDTAGNLFIADFRNHRIRRVDAVTGVIATVAGSGLTGNEGGGFTGDGGPATSASLAWPYGVAVDPSGNLFIADSSNNRVRRVDAATGVITTVAGTGDTGFSGDGGPATSASFALPQSVAVDPSGNLFIADGLNRRIRKVEGVAAAVPTSTPTPTPIPGVPTLGLGVLAGLLLAVFLWVYNQRKQGSGVSGG